MKMLGFLLKGRGGGGYLKTLLSPRVLTEGLGMVHCHVAWGHVTTLGFLIGKIVCRITLKVSPNCIYLLCFGSFAGAGAHHHPVS